MFLLSVMKLIGRFIFHIFSNALAILAAAYFIKSFEFSGSFKALVITALILTAINTFIRPLLKLFFGPLIIITLGLFLIIINAISLYLLDLWSDSLKIQGFLALILSTFIISAVSLVINLTAKKAFKKED